MNKYSENKAKIVKLFHIFLLQKKNKKLKQQKQIFRNIKIKVKNKTRLFSFDFC